MISSNPKLGQKLKVSCSTGDQQAAGCNTEHPLQGHHIVCPRMVLSSIRCQAGMAALGGTMQPRGVGQSGCALQQRWSIDRYCAQQDSIILPWARACKHSL